MPPKKQKLDPYPDFEKKKNPTVPTVLDDDGFVVHPKGLMHRVHPKNKPSVKVLALDLDNTLIRRAKDSNAKGGLPDSKEDFELYNDSVRAVLSDHAARGYQLVVFSNQGAIKTAMGGITSYIVRGVCDNVGKALGEDVPLNFMLATADPKAKGDEYRKPKTGMWDKFVELMNDGQAPDLAECTYVGDAAGRPQDLVTSGINDGDRKFAEGVGIAFKTPEEIFGAPGAGKMENQDLGNAFFELANAFVLKTDDEKKHFRARALRNAGSAIKLHEQVITDVDQVKGVKGIGKGSQDLIREFLDTGKLADIEKIASGEWAKERAEKATTEQKEISKAAEGKAQVQSISSLGSKVAEWDGDTYDMRTFKVAFPKNSGYGDMSTVSIGASIALNGTCLTVTETDMAGNTATFDVIEETLKRTNLGSLREGSAVNFERSARVGDEIGGHTVSGHVQTTARIDSVTTGDGKTRMDFSLSDPFWKKYVLQKGFVSIDGCSLTVGETTGEGGFCVYLIPETLRVTVLGDKAVGDFVNVEVEAQTQAIVDTVERVLAEREANMH